MVTNTATISYVSPTPPPRQREPFPLLEIRTYFRDSLSVTGAISNAVRDPLLSVRPSQLPPRSNPSNLPMFNSVDSPSALFHSYAKTLKN
jgi:hypothetical protein